MPAQLLPVRRQRLDLGLELEDDLPTFVTGAQVTVIADAKRMIKEALHRCHLLLLVALGHPALLAQGCAGGCNPGGQPPENRHLVLPSKADGGSEPEAKSSPW